MSSEPRDPEPSDDRPDGPGSTAGGPDLGGLGLPEDLELDPELSREFGDFLATFRRIESPEPDDRLAAALRARILVRRRYFDPPEPRGLGERIEYHRIGVLRLLRQSRLARWVLILALLSLGVWQLAPLVIGEPAAPERLAGEFDPSEGQARSGTSPAPEPKPQYQVWVRAENDLNRLRALFEERKREALDARLRNLGGGDRRTLARIEFLSDAVAQDLETWQDIGGAGEHFAHIEELSLGIRALLAYGSTPGLGKHARTLREAILRLETMLPSLNGAELATALSAYLEAVLVDGREERMGRLATELSRFVSEQLYLFGNEERQQRRTQEWEAWQRRRAAAREAGLAFGEPEPSSAPFRHSMAHLATPLGALADAGLLLRVAPALGVPVVEASVVRQAFARTLDQRGDREGAQGAAARAAILFSYADLLGEGREQIYASLRSYRLHPSILDRDFRAVHYLAWGLFPVGEGWARINRSLRQFAANEKPETAVGRAALLLTQLLYTKPSLDSRD